MTLILFFVMFIVALVAFFYWQHRYFHPASLKEIEKRERGLLEKIEKEIQHTKNS